MNVRTVTATAHRSRLRGALAGLLATLAIATAACGGIASQTAASAGSPAPAGGEAAAHSAMLAFAACMRSHGVPNFPDPSGGTMQLQSANGKVTVNGQTIDVNGTQFRSAQLKCRSKLPANPNTGNPAQAAGMQRRADRYAACMRSHGVPNFPDPQVSAQGVTIHAKGIDVNSPQFRAAQRDCRSLSPLAGKAAGPAAGG